MEQKKKYTFIDLFAGMGGFRLAMQAQGGKCIFSSEWNSFAQKTYRINFGDEIQGDITQIDEKTILWYTIILVATLLRIRVFGREISSIFLQKILAKPARL
mgnify:CR=1 FL=1